MGVLKAVFLFSLKKIQSDILYGLSTVIAIGCTRLFGTRLLHRARSLGTHMIIRYTLLDIKYFRTSMNSRSESPEGMRDNNLIHQLGGKFI